MGDVYTDFMQYEYGEQLIDAIKDSGERIPISRLQNLCDSVPNRLMSVIGKS